jgi:hypothetical protein
LSPGFTQSAATHFFFVKPIQVPGTNAHPVVQIAWLLPQIQTNPARSIQSEALRTGACETSFSVDASATFAEVGVNEAFIHILTGLAICFGHAWRACFAVSRVANLTWAAPGDTN